MLLLRRDNRVGLRFPRSALMLYCVLVHVSFKALSETTSTTLIPMSLVDRATSFLGTLGFANILPIAVYTSLEKSRTTVAAVDAVVFSRTTVTAYITQYVE